MRTGCILYTCLAGFTPFDVDVRVAEHKKLTRNNILTGTFFPFTDPAWLPISAAAKVKPVFC
jgi:hypothetical protein